MPIKATDEDGARAECLGSFTIAAAMSYWTAVLRQILVLLALSSEGPAGVPSAGTYEPLPTNESTGSGDLPNKEDGQDAPFERGKHRIMGNLGLFSAVGEIGATYTYAPIPACQIELGLGIGFSGPQLSLMPKASLGSDRSRFIFGAGPSVGADGHTVASTYWLNVDVGYEYRTPRGYSTLFAVGITRGLAGQYHDHCPLPDCGGTVEQVKGTTVPQVRFAWGHWF
jgi:hypothetical protein